jgi:hypothetical protein
MEFTTESMLMNYRFGSTLVMCSVCDKHLKRPRDIFMKKPFYVLEDPPYYCKSCFKEQKKKPTYVILITFNE